MSLADLDPAEVPMEAREDGTVHAAPIDLRAPVPELKGTFPLTLYFGNEADRDEFIAIFMEAKPGVEVRQL